jgi:hypothetical protein
MEFLLAMFVIVMYGSGCFVLGTYFVNRALRLHSERIRRGCCEAVIMHDWQAGQKMAQHTKGSARDLPAEAVQARSDLHAYRLARIGPP